MQVDHKQQLDLKDGLRLRTYLESLRNWLQTERATWDAQYHQLARYFMPRNQRFNFSDTNKGFRVDQAIVDNTGTIALRTLRAGLTAGICSPTRKWFTLQTDDQELNKRKDVKIWLEKVGEILGSTLLKSNFYQTAHGAHGDLGLYGTQAFHVLEDEADDIRCYPWPVGSYYLGCDCQGRIDLHLRIYQKSVRQLVDEFGFDNCSQTVQTQYTNNAGGQKEQWYPVVNVIVRNQYFGGPQLLPERKPWLSIWYEQGSFGNPKQSPGMFGLLRKSGYDTCPVIASRWDVVGEDVYGISPAMDALGDTMGLQLCQRRKAEAIDKMVKPPMVASPSMVNQKMSLLPGDVTFADTRDGQHGYRPAFEMKFDIADAMVDIRDHQRRIDSALYKDLFLMLSSSDRREITAEEIRAKQEEKMLVLGPVLERSNGEFLAPFIFRVLGILDSRGKLPARPDALKGRKVAVQFTSILAQVSRMMGVANLDRFMAAVGQEAAVNQGVFDKVDLDEVVTEYGDLLDVPPEIMREDKEVAAIRQQKALAQQQAAQAENAQKMAMAAQNLSKADTSGQNGLTDLLRQTTGAS